MPPKKISLSPNMKRTNNVMESTICAANRIRGFDITFARLQVSMAIFDFLSLWYISLNSTNTLPRAVLTLTILCGCFTIICAIFTYLQLAIVKEGMTTNEQDKWYTIQEYMREGKLVRSLDDDCPSWFFKCTEQKDDAAEPLQDQHVTFYSTNAYDHKHYNLTHYITIKDASEIPNIYDKGTFLANLTDLI
ncbi:unnamed protein product [Saccharomyces cerevisiae]|nr:palmitoyltransferase [Saccharomyces cerevisiae]GES70769.1 hypothetical protein SCEPF1_0061002100 [Saccharomyces cerevisiae]GMC20989.1 unnamed protein product [Saccharomyces cerevisiae]